MSYTLSSREIIQKIDNKFLPSTAQEVIDDVDPEAFPTALTPNKFYNYSLPLAPGFGATIILVDFSSVKVGECYTCSGLYANYDDSPLDFAFHSADNSPINAVVSNISTFEAHTQYSFTIQMFNSPSFGYSVVATFTACGAVM